MFVSTPITPKDGRCVKVLLICRVSSPGEGKQDIRSLDDQEQMLRRWVADNLGDNVEIEVIAGSGSGERLDRLELLQAEEAIETGRYDLVLAEDLGRILRRNRALDFCELAEDHKTRVIALNDNVDTAQHRWRTLAAFAAMRHEMSRPTGSSGRRTTALETAACCGRRSLAISSLLAPSWKANCGAIQRQNRSTTAGFECSRKELRSLKLRTI